MEPSRSNFFPARPNFFLAGAAKCGTTSLSRYLAAHPRIFFSHPKEPHFFCTDYYEHNRIWTERQYLRLFRRASRDHLAIGEGSVWYIASRVAASRILAFNPAAKFIVMVRSPLEMAPSLHSQNVFDCYENEPDFELAWRKQAARRRGLEMPFLCCEPKELMYSDRCMLGAQIERLFRIVPRDQVKIVVMDDLRADPRTVYESVLAFLEVPSDGRVDFPIHNENKVARWPAWNRVLALGGKFKQTCGLHISVPWGPSLVRFAGAPAVRKTMRPEFINELRLHFTADVELLSRLLDRDLTGWLKPAESDARAA
jgi:hypothetical protein